MIVRTAEERARIITAGKHLGEILDTLTMACQPRVSTLEIDRLAEKMIAEYGDHNSLFGYKPDGARTPYPATLCISINNEVVHGIPNVDRFLKDGDIVGLDLVLDHQGLFVDSALTVAVGKVSPEAKKLIAATRSMLLKAIKVARPGARIGDISHVIETECAKTGFSIVKVLGGHGVGTSVHEEPFVANFGHAGTGPEIVPGMVIAIEPIVNAGKGNVVLQPDGYTYITRDGSLSAHFEHSVLIEEDRTIILTQRPSER